MSKLVRYITGSRVNYGRIKGYGQLSSDGGYESQTSSFAFRVPRKLRVARLSTRRGISNGEQESNSKQQLRESRQPAVKQASSTLIGRLRVRYEKMMLKVSIPVAKASRAPPALSSVVNTWTVSSSFGSRKGTKISDLDPGFKMTTAEKMYVERLKRTASSRSF